MWGDLMVGYGLWPQLLLVLAAGTVVIIGVGAALCVLLRSAVWQRTIWQIVTLGLLVLVLVEITGTGPTLVQLGRTSEGLAVRPSDLGTPSPRPSHELRSVPASVSESPGGVGLPLASKFSGGAYPALPSSAARAEPASIKVSSAYGPNRAGWEYYDATTWPSEDHARSGPRVFNGTVQGTPGVVNGDLPSVPDTPGELSASGAGARSAWGAWWLLGAIWALGVAVAAGRIGCSRLLLVWFRHRHAVRADATLCRRVGRLSRRLGLRRRVRVLAADRLAAPVAFGSFRPTVVLPASFARRFDVRQQEAMFAHELAHLATGDPAWQLLSELVCAVLWWHPLAWWSRRRLLAANETAADEASLLLPDGPGVLADCLVAMGRRLVRQRQLGWLSIGGSGFRSPLGRRVERLLNLPARPRRTPPRGRLALARGTFPVILAIVAVSCTVWARPRATFQQGETKMSVLRSSWRGSLAATALALMMTSASADPMPRADLPDDNLLAQRDDREGEEGERRESADRKEGDRERGEGEEREHRDGEARERREGESRERREGERREGEERERREIAEREVRHREHGEGHEREAHERRQAEEREKAEHRRAEMKGRLEHLNAERREIEEKAEATERRVREMGEDNADREPLMNHFRELQQVHGRLSREIEEIAGALEGRRHPDRHPHEGEHRCAELKGRHEHLMAERREIEEKAEAIERRVREMGDEENDDREPLMNHLRELEQVHDRLSREIEEIAGALEGRRHPDRHPREGEIRERLQEMEHEIHRLSELGRHDAAERLKREGRELMERLKQRPQRDRPGPAPGLERRIHHMAAAAENLRAAGLHDAAENIAQQIEKIKQGVDGHAPRQPERRDGPPPPERVMQELHEQVQQLRREIQEMREQLQHLRERDR